MCIIQTHSVITTNLLKNPFLIILILFVTSCKGITGADNNSDSLDSTTLSEESGGSNESVSDSTEKTIYFKNVGEVIQWMKESGSWEKYEAGIIPQMAEDELDYAAKLINNQHQSFIIVDKATMKVYLYDRFGREIKNYGMACSRCYGTKHKKGDNRTAEGFFSAEGIYDSTEWLYTDDNGNTSPVKGQFGPRFIRLLIPYTRAIGIHGTSSPWSIGGRRSHGCIRLTNENILDLVNRVEVGTPIIVSPGPYDMYVNLMEGYHIPSVSPIKGKPRAVAASSMPKGKYSSGTPNVQNQANDSVSKKTENLPSVDSVATPSTSTEENNETEI